jgi:hypothetical protein
MITLSVLDQSVAVTGRTEDASIRETLQLARHCEALGYRRFWVSEHHSHPSIVGSAPEVLMAAIAATTSRIRVGSAGVMLPHYAALKVHRRQPAQARLAAETQKLWPQWRAEGDALREAKADATLLWIKAQEDAGLDIVTDGEQSRQHFVHGFLEQVEGIDFQHKVEMGIRNDRYKAMVPQVVAPLKLKGRVHAAEARLARAHTTRKLKFTLPGPMTIVDTVADQPLRRPARWPWPLPSS